MESSFIFTFRHRTVAHVLTVHDVIIIIDSIVKHDVVGAKQVLIGPPRTPVDPLVADVIDTYSRLNIGYFTFLYCLDLFVIDHPFLEYFFLLFR